MRTVHFDAFGPPAEVLRCLPELPCPPGRGQVEVALEAAAIHPQDLTEVRGGGIRGQAPGAIVPGAEGVGRVVATGPNVELEVGTRVLLPLGSGTWRDRLIVSARRVRVVSADGDPLQQCLATLAPATAWGLLATIPQRRGEWVLQNAGHRTVGRMVAHLAKQRGIRTVSLVKTGTEERSVRLAGGDVALVTHAEVLDDVRAYTRGASVRLALDGLGGDATDLLAACLDVGGTLVHHHARPDHPCRLSSAQLVHRGIVLRGFAWTSWFRQTPSDELEAVLSQLHDQAQALHHPIMATYPLNEVARAVAHAEQDDGQIVLTGEAYVPAPAS